MGDVRDSLLGAAAASLRSSTHDSVIDRQWDSTEDPLVTTATYIQESLSTKASDTTGLFGSLQVPYIVIIWVVALTSSLVSIAMCFLCNHLQKRSRRRQRNVNPTSTENEDSKVANKTEAKSPLKIANPLSCRDSCAICCEPYTGSQDDLIIGYIRSCGHYFHHACAWRWTCVRENCPLCRNPVNLKDGDMQGMTLKELEELLGVPNGTLRRKGSKRKDRPDLSIIDETTGQIRTISLTLDQPIVITNDGARDEEPGTSHLDATREAS